MSGFTAVMLLFPASLWEPVWRLNPQARAGFVSIGGWAVALMVSVCLACSIAACGLWRLTRWGLVTALVILVVNLLGDAMNAFMLGDWRTLIGLPIGGIMIGYLLLQNSRRRFGPA